MELSIKPWHKNTYPAGGLLIRQSSAAAWLNALSALRLGPGDVSIYPVPGTTPNSVWGCFVLTSQPIDTHRAGRYELCQRVSGNFFIPEKSRLHPPMSEQEIEGLFSRNIHVLHPEFGLAELEHAVELESLVAEPVMRSYHVTRPEPPVFVPGLIRSFSVKPATPEEILKNMEEKIFPKKESMKDDSLSAGEKARLFFYRFLYTSKKEKDGQITGSEKTGFWSGLGSLLGRLSGGRKDVGRGMQEDFEDLERRNRKQLDKLLDMLKNNPHEALKYAIPIDERGTSRGQAQGSFTLLPRWFNFSLFSTDNRDRSGGTIDLGDGTQALREQYRQSALRLIEEKEYHKAAFIYMKLLNDPYQAAQTLEQGGFYQEAAVLYLKHGNYKAIAAWCYEKGNMTEEAIVLYKELGENEKVGDLYIKLGKRQGPMFIIS
jgi:hypothetical protein